MSIYTPEIPAAFGALDSVVYEDGGPVDAHVLRTLATSAARLVSTGEPLINMVWDASSDLGGDEAEGAMLGYGWPFWFRVTPGPISRAKMPGLTRAQGIVRAKLRSSEVVTLQVETRRRPFDAARTTGDDNVITLTGSGAFGYTTLADIPIDPSDTERVAFWLKGEPTSTTGDTGTYGPSATGTISRLSAYDVLDDDTAAWNVVGPTWADGGHCVVVQDSGGNNVTEPRVIRFVKSATQIQVYPSFEPGFFGDRIAGLAYKILELPRWRLTQLALYAQDRET